MEQFKKWWRGEFSSRKGNDNSYLGYPEAHQAWKAALEWVQDTKFRDTDESLYDLLKEELGDE